MTLSGRELDGQTMKLTDLKIIQGGMGINVSSWNLASAVSKTGQLGVVSGTAIDTVIARMLQNGDTDGSIRHALDHFPFQDMANRVKKRFFKEEGKPEDKPYKGIGMPTLNLGTVRSELLIVSNYVAVFLAKRYHENWVGINYLEKIQIPTLPSLFGAMLAGVNVVLMGAGIPASIPGILDDLAELKPVSLRIEVENADRDEVYFTHFDPNDFIDGAQLQLERPKFLAIVSTDIVARSLEKRATGYIDGYVVENHTAGGHNAPPRKDRSKAEGAPPAYGEKDVADLDKFRAIGKPFWLAGQYSTPEKFQSALKEGATGVQIGTPFAYCNESAILPEIKRAVIEQSISGDLEIETSFVGSPTGYPFKTVKLKDSPYSLEDFALRKRVCDMGYLRSAVLNEEKKIEWRCPAEPIEDYVRKGGKAADCEGKLCLCNGLASTVGVSHNPVNKVEVPLITSGDEVLNIHRYCKNDTFSYSAKDVINHTLQLG
jgi:nitronate monooxygenase